MYNRLAELVLPLTCSPQLLQYFTLLTLKCSPVPAPMTTFLWLFQNWFGCDIP